MIDKDIILNKAGKIDHHLRRIREKMDVTLEEVRKVMAEHEVLHLIHGHTHRPAIHTLEINHQAAIRRVLGDWDQQGWVLTYQNGSFETQYIDYRQ